MKNNWVWLDMDGTIADLYSVDGWLDDLLAHNTRPYAQAKAIYDTVELLMVLLRLKMLGYKIGVISWGSKENNPAYDREVELVKKEWLRNLGYDLVLDKVIVTPYGVRKADTCRVYGSGLLVDDEQQNRDAWDLGATINANDDIIKALQKLL